MSFGGVVKKMNGVEGTPTSSTVVCLFSKCFYVGFWTPLLFEHLQELVGAGKPSQKDTPSRSAFSTWNLQTTMVYDLGGGFQHFFIFHLTWGNDPIKPYLDLCICPQI